MAMENFDGQNLSDGTIVDDSANKSYLDTIFNVSIIANGEVTNVVLSDFRKERITFGRDKSNDIVIPSLFASKYHGFFEIKNNVLKVYDNDSKNGLIINNQKIKEYTLSDNDYIRIDNINDHNPHGILFLVKIGQNVHRWNHYRLHKTVTRIGNASGCNVMLLYKSDVEDFIEIRKEKNNYTLFSMGREVFVNSNLVEDNVILDDNDVIQIEDLKLIYSRDEIIYQFAEKGVRVDVRGIYNTVRIKGKKVNISEDINMTISPGKFVAFVGASGVGKTTLMLSMCGLNKPTKGQVLINGSDLFKNYEQLKNNIGYVPQDDIVFTNLTLIDMLKYSADLRMPLKSTAIEKQRRIKEVLDTVDLTGKEDVLIRNLSGGQRKRAGIAVELLADPRLFFLDEPTSGLDPENERRMMLTLRKMADSGRTVILVTHNTLNLHLCDRVVFFGDGGKICYDGFPNQANTFFGTKDLIDVYLLIGDDADKWHQKYLDEQILPDVASAEDSEHLRKVKQKEITNTSSVSQYFTLTKRYIKTILNNRTQLLLLLIQTPIIVLMMSLIMTDKIFEVYERSKEIMFCISLAALYLGLGNSIQEICKERVILKKEHMANLRLSSYVFSKITVFALLSVIQAILFVYMFGLFIETPSDGIIYYWKFEVIATMALTIFCSSTLGLLVSSFAKDESMAMTYVPLLLVPQSLFCGILFELKGKILTISTFILCRWSIEMFGTTNDFNGMIDRIQEVVPGYIRQYDPMFEYTATHFYNCAIIIGLMALTLILTCYFILRKKLEVKR